MRSGEYRKKKYHNEEIQTNIQTHQVIYKIQNGMVQDIKVSSSIKCIKAHLKTKYDHTQCTNHAIGISIFFKEKGLTITHLIRKHEKHMVVT